MMSSIQHLTSGEENQDYLKRNIVYPAPVPQTPDDQIQAQAGLPPPPPQKLQAARRTTEDDMRDVTKALEDFHVDDKLTGTNVTPMGPQGASQWTGKSKAQSTLLSQLGVVGLGAQVPPPPVKSSGQGRSVPIPGYKFQKVWDEPAPQYNKIPPCQKPGKRDPPIEFSGHTTEGSSGTDSERSRNNEDKEEDSESGEDEAGAPVPQQSSPGYQGQQGLPPQGPLPQGPGPPLTLGGPPLTSGGPPLTSGAPPRPGPCPGTPGPKAPGALGPGAPDPQQSSPGYQGQQGLPPQGPLLQSTPPQGPSPQGPPPPQGPGPPPGAGAQSQQGQGPGALGLGALGPRAPGPQQPLPGYRGQRNPGYQGQQGPPQGPGPPPGPGSN